MLATPILAFLVPLLASTADDAGKKSEETARGFLEAVLKGDFERAVRDFDATMKKKMPADKLDEFWKTLTKQIGPLKKQLAVRTEKAGKLDAILITCDFEKTKLDLRVVVDADGKIGGFQLVPSTHGLTFKAPPYA